VAITAIIHKGGKLMTVRPLHDRVLIKRIEEQETMKGGIIIPDTAKEKSQEGEVISVGTGKTLENGSIVPLEVKEGDRILFGKYSGTEIKLQDQDYLILREDEIVGILTHAGKTASKK
jgi:chaperonin GroES